MTLPQPKASIIFQRVDDGAILFAPETELYFGLNEVGAFIWEALAAAPASLEELCTRVVQRYPDAEAATVRADVEELLDRLDTEGLTQPRVSSGDAVSVP